MQRYEGQEFKNPNRNPLQIKEESSALSGAKETRISIQDPMGGGAPVIIPGPDLKALKGTESKSRTTGRAKLSKTAMLP